MHIAIRVSVHMCEYVSMLVLCMYPCEVYCVDSRLLGWWWVDFVCAYAMWILGLLELVGHVHNPQVHISILHLSIDPFM